MCSLQLYKCEDSEWKIVDKNTKDWRISKSAVIIKRKGGYPCKIEIAQIERLGRCDGNGNCVFLGCIDSKGKEYRLGQKDKQNNCKICKGKDKWENAKKGTSCKINPTERGLCDRNGNCVKKVKYYKDHDKDEYPTKNFKWLIAPERDYNFPEGNFITFRLLDCDDNNRNIYPGIKKQCYECNGETGRWKPLGEGEACTRKVRNKIKEGKCSKTGKCII